jgi:chromosomal replication initiation ATPase DnaA
MIIISEENEQLIDNVENLICKYFNVPTQSIVNKDNSAQVSIARSYVFYFLHCIFKLPISVISLTYYKKRRTVFWNVNKVKCLIEKHKMHKNIFKDLTQELSNAKLC